jgi:hypothetical protein
MGLRETLNKSPALGYGAGGVVVVLALVLLWMNSGIGGGGPSAGGEPQRYYSIDEGKTYFADAAMKVPPFDKDGKQAVLAHVFRDIDNKIEFVGYLSRYTPEGKKMAEERAAKAAAGDFGAIEGVVIPMEYKRPGESAWVKTGDPRVSAMTTDLKSPKGSTNVEPVYPE